MKRAIALTMNSLLLVALFLYGCAKQDSATTPTLRTISEVSAVNIQSGAIVTSARGIASRMLGRAVADPQAAPLTDFKICVKRIKLEDEDGNIVVKDPNASTLREGHGSDHESNVGESQSEAESESELEPQEKADGELVFSPGLIDLTDAQAKSWGTVELPVGFRLKKLSIKVKKDKERCGVDYSLSYNGATTSEDIEFKWRFEPAIDLEATTAALQLSFDSVIANLQAAAASGSINSLKDRVEEVEDEASAE